MNYQISLKLLVRSEEKVGFAFNIENSNYKKSSQTFKQYWRTKVDCN